MYLPKHFSNAEWRDISSLIRQNGFATVLSFSEDKSPNINHFPVIFENDSADDPVLIGHMARRNPQWSDFQKVPSAIMVFHGPHAYVSPTWYRSGRDVPTWNYAVVHLHGKIELIESFEGQMDILQALSRFFEGSERNPWMFELPDDLRDPKILTSAIVSFRFRPEKVEAKWKLSQNRSEEDRLGVIEGLAKRNDAMSEAVRQMMLEREKRRHDQND